MIVLYLSWVFGSLMAQIVMALFDSPRVYPSNKNRLSAEARQRISMSRKIISTSGEKH